MTQLENAPSSETESKPDPFDPKELAKKDLSSLEALFGISEANLESKILERNKKSKELKELDREFGTSSRHGNTAVADELRFKCRVAADEQHALNLEIKRRNDQLLDIRETIVEKRNPL